MKIAILSPAFSMGGSSIVATKIGEGLSEKGHEIIFVSYLKSQQPNTTCKYYDLYKRKNPISKNVLRICKALEYKLSGEFKPEKYVRREKNLLKEVILKEDPDVIIFNTFIPSVLFSRFIKLDFPSIKLITWMHSDPIYSLNHIAKFYKKTYKESFSTVDYVVCLSNETQSNLKKYNKNIRVIYNPLTLEDSQSISKLEKKVIAFTARYDISVKGFDYLCQVAKYIPDGWIIRVAGDGTNKEREELKNLIKLNDVAEKIVCVGALSGEDLINHYTESSMFISTSRSEGLPLVMIEAMSYGLPIVSFSHSGAKEILQNGKYGIIVQQFNVESMTEQIKKLISNPISLKKFQRLSLERSLDFKEDKILKEWELLLNNVRNEDV